MCCGRQIIAKIFILVDESHDLGRGPIAILTDQTVDFGIFAEVVTGGEIAIGDGVSA